MQYLILINSDEGDGAPGPGDPGFEEMMGAWMGYNQMLIDNGHYVSGASLAPTVTATTVRKTADGVTISDGPHIETKEALGGYYMVEADDLDKATELAQLIPIDVGSLEIRPVAFNPDSMG